MKLHQLGLLVICCLLSSFLYGQTYEGLIPLKGYGQPVFISPGQEKRAEEIAPRCDRASLYFQELVNFQPTTPVLILNPMAWPAYSIHPVYGMPNYDEVNKRLMIAAEDNDFWRSFIPPLDQLPPALATSIKKAYTNTEGNVSMMPFFDLLALHELGHGFHDQAKLNMQRLWMQELFVNLMLHTYVAENEPALLPALETFPEMVVAGGPEEYQHTSLTDFEKLYDNMDAKNYGWYQCRLHVAAKNIYNAGGKNVIVKLWKALKEEKEKLNDEQLSKLLKSKVHPSIADVMLKW